MKLLKWIFFPIGLLSFWISLFLIIPLFTYYLIRGFTWIAAIDFINVNLFNYGTILWEIENIFYDLAPLISICLWILALLCTYEFWTKWYRTWKWILLSLLIPIGAFVSIIIVTGHTEVTTFFTSHHSINLDKDFVISGYQENIPDQQNGYYRQNQWLTENSWLLLSWAKVDNNKLIQDLSGIVNLTYSKTKYKDPLFPIEARKGSDWTSYILQQKDPQLAVVWYKFVRQRMGSFVNIMELLIEEVLQKQMFDFWKQELPTMPISEKLQLLSVLTPYDTTGIYDGAVVREYYFVVYYIVDVFADNNAKLPIFLLDEEETKSLAWKYFNSVRHWFDISPDDPSFGISWKENYLGYNMVGIRWLQALIPRLTGISNRLVTLEQQRQSLVQDIQNSL